MNMYTVLKYDANTHALFFSLLLIGCGGGSGNMAAAPAVPVASTLAFPLQQAHKTLIANGAKKSFVVSGSCAGTATMTRAPAITPAVFELNPAALSAVTTLAATLTSSPGFVCAPTLVLTSTEYYDSTYTPLGANVAGGSYGVFLAAPTIPATVKVGATAAIGTETLYTDSTKVTGNGRIDMSYVVEPDTATTAIVNVISKSYDAVGALTATEQDRSRISSTGALAPISIDILYSAGIHLIFN